MADNLKLFFSYVRLNLLSHMSYRIAFISQFFFMLINDIFLLFFWWVFFSGFKTSNGWNLNDVFLLYAISAGIFGIAAVFFGNAFSLSRMIQQGEIDNYLLNPAPLLFHILISSSIVAGWGDIVFSVISFMLAGYLSFYAVSMYLLGLFTGTIIFISFLIIFNSLTFYIDSAESLTKLMREALLTFSLYPGNLFSGMIKILLFTIIPAGFMTYVPVSLIKSFDIYSIASLAGFSAFMLICAIQVFYNGMKRYSSGNIILSRM